MQSPEQKHLANAIRLAGEVDRIGVRSVQVLKQASNRIIRQLSVTKGNATSQALMAQLAQIQQILQQAGVEGYAQFVDDLASKQSTWAGRDAGELKAEIESAVDQGLMAQQTATAGPAVGAGINAQQQALLSQQALRVASTMPPLQLAVVGSKKQPYSLAREYARGFMQPDGQSTQTAYLQQVQRLQDTFEKSVRQAVVTGQTTQDLVRSLRQDGGPGSLEPSFRAVENVARTGAQSVANAIQRATLEENPSVKYVRYTATLDRRTSPVCRSLDGEIFRKADAPVPPLHFGCRSTLVAHIPGREEGSRSMTMMVKGDDGKVRSYGAYDPKIQDRLTDSQKRLLEQNKSGKPPSYEDWLKAQPASAQDVVLGRKNGQRFRANNGSLTKATTPSAKRALKALPKPLTQKQVKPLPKPKVNPRPGPDKVDPPPAKPAPPAGTTPSPKVPPKPSTPSPGPVKAKPAPKKKKVPVAKKLSPVKAAPVKATAADPEFKLVNKQLGLSQAQWEAKSPAAKKMAVKAAEKKAAPKPKPVFNTPANQKKIQQLTKSLQLQEQQLAKASTPFSKKTIQQGIDKAKKELAALGVQSNLTPGQQLQQASKILATGKPGTPEFEAAKLQAQAAKAAQEQLAKALAPKAMAKTQLPKRQRGAKATGVKSENKKVSQQGDRAVSNVEYRPKPVDLGWEQGKMDEFQGDLIYWSDLGYRRMRGAQLVKNKARPKKGSPDWTLVDEYKKGYGEGEQREFLGSANNLEDFISRAPKYKGPVHRGILLPDDAAYDSFMKDLSGSKRVNTLESWSADSEIADQFANGTNSGKGRSPGIEVVMHVENRHGSPVAGFSSLADEEEVLMPSRVRYRVLKKKVITELDEDLQFDPDRAGPGKRKRVEIWVEQIED